MEISTMIDCKWGVYILRRVSEVSEPGSKQGSRDLYCGMTNDIRKRFKQHLAGKVSSTKGSLWELVAFAAYRSRSEAATVEAWMKVGDSRAKRSILIEAMSLPLYDRIRVVHSLLMKARAWKVGRELRQGMGIYPGTATKEADREVGYE